MREDCMAEERPGAGDARQENDERPAVERLSISVTWERIAPASQGKVREVAASESGANMDSGNRGVGRREDAESDPVGATGSDPGAGQPGKAASGPGSGTPDWSHVRREGEELREVDDLSEQEVEADLVLLDDAFLKRTFKEVRFPASKELCLRFVDQEQDFAYGLDRTVNLHHVITHLEAEEFPTRRDLLNAIKNRIHHHAVPRPGA
jgi:hypothetical protein